MGDPVGMTEIAERLGVGKSTVSVWRSRGIFPDERWTVSSSPCWEWADIDAWARSTGRLPAGAPDPAPAPSEPPRAGYGGDVGQLAEALRAAVAESKTTRQLEAQLWAADKEVRAALLAQEKREVEQEKERLRMASAMRHQRGKSIENWDHLIKEVKAAWTLIAAYSKLFDDLPAVNPAYVHLLDRELATLRQQLDWFDRKLHPEGHSAPLHEGTIIDV